ncbi:hypothetical protein [Psychrobacter maritimus]|uniref:hypothetical protein n=1 Tax=Psychrobacter maritimus TaxID=256325 RepID=UPI001918EC7F|nr:hypothetical protein [Psychrobacter maritimus]
MAKPKLSKAAIGFIIEKRNDWNVNYTFADIAELLKEDFGITITEQGVSKSYRKYKDDEKAQTLLVSAKKKDLRKGNSRMDSTNGNLEIPNTTKYPRDFDEDAGKNYDVNDFFMKE